MGGRRYDGPADSPGPIYKMFRKRTDQKGPKHRHSRTAKARQRHSLACRRLSTESSDRFESIVGELTRRHQSLQDRGATDASGRPGATTGRVAPPRPGTPCLSAPVASTPSARHRTTAPDPLPATPRPVRVPQSLRLPPTAAPLSQQRPSRLPRLNRRAASQSTRSRLQL